METRGMCCEPPMGRSAQWDRAVLPPRMRDNGRACLLSDARFPQYWVRSAEDWAENYFHSGAHCFRTPNFLRVCFLIHSLSRHVTSSSDKDSNRTSEQPGVRAGKSMRPPRGMSACRPISIHSSDSSRGAATIISSRACSFAGDDSNTGSGWAPTFQIAVRMGMN